MSIILVTGAGHGIGAAIALAFAKDKKDSHQLILVGRNEENLLNIQQQCRSLDAEVEYFLCDLSIEKEVNMLKNKIISSHGIPDVIINNAGEFQPIPISECSSETFHGLLNSNLSTAFFVCKAFLAEMMARKRGDIFFIGSISAITAPPNCGAYTTSKHALLGLARSLREECKPHGIRVISLLPGATYTDAWINDPRASDQAKLIPPEDIAALVYQCHQLSPRTTVEEVILRPQQGNL